MNRKTLFCKSLAPWLLDSPWSYSGLLTTFINVVAELPNDVDKVVNKILSRFDSPPSKRDLEAFLQTESHIQTWFLWNTIKPRLSRWNLTQKKAVILRPNTLPLIENEHQLAAWLGLSHGELIWLSGLFRAVKNPSATLINYHYSAIEKRRGGLRLLESPKPLLKDVQRQIHHEILRHVEVDASAQAYQRGGSNLNHARQHQNKRFVFTFDLKHFFPNITRNQVDNQFRKLGYDAEVSKTLSGLCTHRVSAVSLLPAGLEKEQLRLAQTRHLPQGAPCSPVLSNMVCSRLDRRLKGLANSLSLDYSRFADDLAFSGNALRDWSFLESLVGSICLEEGFELNHRKSRKLYQHQRQKITGVVVNKKANIDRRYFDQLKAIIHNCAQHGIKSQNRANHHNFYQHLLGRVNYVCQLNPTKGKKLKSIFKTLDPLS